jgi:hypothetical protein
VRTPKTLLRVISETDGAARAFRLKSSVVLCRDGAAASLAAYEIIERPLRVHTRVRRGGKWRPC